ncbi:ATP-binding cassette domain-containing protein [Cryobacterium sp. Sr3]|uniref:ATP-binding cassette domain-containing protein n=1 Tax=Cryobacterium sp. Sr3 TaxID=1259194 RepID=UPI00106DA4F0|nr:ATP-binding cassette domain-containing protein [Cryobacterium sp. Sr3]TFB59623.1 ABC transporter ATP-binding protein [Cryobacterium sp. Sr3]
MLVTVSGLGHWFHYGAPLFQDLNFQLTSGDLIAVLGSSGSGKSTLLAILAGWLKPAEGRVDVSPLSSITWVPQNPFGVPGRTLLDHLVFPLIASGVKRSDAEFQASEALADFGLGGARMREFSQLSGGEAQRLMLARAAIGGAQIVLVDEPTAQLDPLSAQSVIDVLGKMAGEGRVVVVATHDTRVANSCRSTLTLGHL